MSYPEIWLAEIVAGAPFFFGEADAEDFGVSAGETVALGLTKADSSGDGEGVGEALCFFFLLALGDSSEEGLGDDFFFFGEEEVVGSGVSEGVGVADVFFFFGDGDFSGVAVGFGAGDFSAVAVGFGVGDFSVSGFFFVFFRGVGVGVGAKIFLNLVPKDSSALAFATAPKTSATTTRKLPMFLIFRIERGR